MHNLTERMHYAFTIVSPANCNHQYDFAIIWPTSTKSRKQSTLTVKI